ncbi:MAG: class I SAM-dependent methyltransferase [Burkholderiaceae bacterium]|nr:class I SAM-dependent methyltransferase [Burkholderiaceae bacterium]
MQTFWDQRFAEPGFKYGTTPNAFLRGQAQAIAPGATVLLPGDGEGRNSVWLATRGHPVLAVDYSEVGLAKARRLAQQAGPEVDARLRTQWVDLAEWTPEPASVDAVAAIYCHLDRSIRRDAHRRLAAALRPGGLLLLEAFHPRQLGRPSGGPKDEDMLYTLDDLRGDFAGLLDERFGWEGEVLLDEGPGHQGAAVVTRYVGRRV